MLEIQKFIKAHQNWRELLIADPYNLKISEDDGFILFKYNQISSDFSKEICREARGLILDSLDNFRVVRYAFRKFFNIDEPYADRLDWDTAMATEKIDGSIMSVWFARGKWHLSTNGTIDAFKAPLAGELPYKTFGELFEAALPMSWFEDKNRNYCWTFELVSPYNKVVIDYLETAVYLLSLRLMNTLEEKDLSEVAAIALNVGLQMPHFYYMNDEAGFRRLVEKMPEGHEGIVVRDADGKRVKIKTLLYFEMHRAKNNGVITLERIVDLIRQNDHFEFLSYFPEYEPIFKEVEEQVAQSGEIIKEIQQFVQNWKETNSNLMETNPTMARKWFVQDCDKKFFALAMAEYDNKLDFTLKNLTTKKFISLFKIKVKGGKI